MIDKVEIYVKAGDGGRGVVSFRREKYVPRGGPDGGNGGSGGSVIIQSDSQINTLRYFSERQKFVAESGEKGASRKRKGADAEDIVLRVPIGTLVQLKISNDKFQTVADLGKLGMKTVVVRGGTGGFGNFHFRGPENRTPREVTEGEVGEEKSLVLELKLLADVGLIGLPNVGKSTLLSVLTKAKPKIADYPFTTLEPNLGVMARSMRSTKGTGDKDLVIADIPGLIEGASKGKGLGDDFLRHAERTKLLVHIVSPQLESSKAQISKQLWKDYEVIRAELKEYGGELDKKREMVVVNKIDLIDKDTREEISRLIKKKKRKIVLVSAATLEGIEQLKKEINTNFSRK